MAVNISNSAVGDSILQHSELIDSFREARRKLLAVEKSSKRGDDPENQTRLRESLAGLEACAQGIRRLQVFSKNELAREDVNTEDLPLLLTDYFYGKACQKLAPSEVNGPAGRYRVVKLAASILEKFLETCLEKGLMDDCDKKAFERLQTISEGKRPSREEKLERFKLNSSAKKRLAQVESIINAASTSDCEDLTRERSLLELTCAIKDTFDDLDALAQEEMILKHMTENNIQFSSSSPEKKSTPTPSKGMTVTHIGKDLKATRQTIGKKVFGKSWAQPTMTLDEVAQIELREAAEREKREKQFRAENPEVLTGEQMRKQGLEDDMEIADKAAKKDRDWDDWKDDNPKGMGVTKRF